LMAKHGIPGSPRYKVFRSARDIEAYLKKLGEYVIKPDGLTAGKGVKVSGIHLASISEALAYCDEILSGDRPIVVIEERLEGEEFSLQTLSDGKHSVDTVVVQDHKRAYENDEGPNTGGMGSYSCEDHGLPFLEQRHIEEASRINASVLRALREEVGHGYRGILYGGFMLTADGLRVLEFNARFGDPEALNVLSILKSDLVDICEAIISGRLSAEAVSFRRSATVCKYLVPKGYPEQPVRGVPIDLSAVPPESDSLRVYPAGLVDEAGELLLTGSRAIAVVGIGSTLADAEAAAETAASLVHGAVYHRRDIGTPALVRRKVEHMKALIGRSQSSRQGGPLSASPRGGTVRTVR